MPPHGPDKGRIDRIYVCKQCNACFLFESDVQDHQSKSGHEGVREVGLDD